MADRIEQVEIATRRRSPYSLRAVMIDFSLAHVAAPPLPKTREVSGDPEGFAMTMDDKNPAVLITAGLIVYLWAVFRNMTIIQMYMQVFGSISIPIRGIACAHSTTGR